MTISKKLYTSLGAIVALVLILGTAAWTEFSAISTQVVATIASTHKLALAGEIHTLTADMLSQERGMLVRTYSKEPELVEKYSAGFSEDLDKRLDVVKEFQSIATAPAAKEALQSFEDHYASRKELHQQFVELCKAGDGTAAAAMMTGKMIALADENEARSQTLAQIANQQVTDDAAEMQSAIATGRWIIGVVIVLAVAVSFGVFFVVRQINLALAETISELSGGADQIAAAASEVSNSSQSLAQGSSEQAASLEESSASAEEINSMARRTSEDAGVMTTVVSSSQGQFVSTNQQLTEMVTAMDEINDSSSKISKIIKVIDEIAFQTNILALNAAVEAARAGQAGMGFAVVADEVRNLAQRCAQAARDTTELIEDSVTKSSGGKTKLGVVASSIKQITDEFGKVKMLVDQVAHGSGEQSRGIEQIRTALGQMEQVTQSTAANAEESAAAAEELNAQSEALKNLVIRLNAMVGGGVGQKAVSYASSIHRQPNRALDLSSRNGSKTRSLKPAKSSNYSNSSMLPLAGDPVETM
jgi:methyl-accepting chemotaxis protein